jgi:aspartate/methionine/tyrosine aminotransferase
VSYDTQAYLTGKAVTWLPTQLEDNYCLTPEGLSAGLRMAREAGHSPTLLVLNSPGNPTGVVYPSALLQQLAEVARREGLIIISDEIYGLTTYGDTPHTCMALHYPEGAIVTGGLSKHLSLGGWRLGVAILPPGKFGGELYQYMAAVASNVWTTVTAPVQYAAIVAYSDDPEIDAYVEACTQIHGYVTRYLYQALQAVQVPCSSPGGGFYVYPDFGPWREALARKHNVHTNLDLANFLLDEEHIAALPGSDFGAAPHDLTLRLATSYLYALTEEEGEAILTTFRKNLSPDQFLREACPNVIAVGEKFKAFMASL